MRDFFEWYRCSFCTDEQWLILGKGPSFSKIGSIDISGYRTLGLNHVVQRVSVFVAHAIDIEVIEHCGEKLLTDAGMLVMPWIPHCRKQVGWLSRRAFFGVGELTLEEHCARSPVLNRLKAEGRLLWYNLNTAGPGQRRPGSPVVDATEFSASAALNLLALAGASKIRTLGVDGGSSYSDAFQHLEATTRLQTGQDSYDGQFRGIAKTLMGTRVDFAPLGVESPIKVYVGSQPEQMLALKVLEYSIRRHCSMSVEVAPLYEAIEAAGLEVPTPRDPLLQPRTPFSFQRFAIPALKRYSGRAIYLDSDMEVFRDIKTLWTWPFRESHLLTVKEPAGSGRRPQFSVMVLDCERLDWDVTKLIRQLEDGRWTYEQFMYEMAPADRLAAILPSTWNDLERHSRASALTHYTDMDRQPWLIAESWLGHIWCEELLSAIRDGFIASGFVQEQVDRKWVRPSLMHQVRNEVVDPLLLPGEVLNHDRLKFVPPHQASQAPRGQYRRSSAQGAVKRLALRAAAHGRQCLRIAESQGRRLKRRIWSVGMRP